MRESLLFFFFFLRRSLESASLDELDDDRDLARASELPDEDDRDP